MGGAAREGQTEPGVQTDLILGKNNQNMVLSKDESALLARIFSLLTLVAVNSQSKERSRCFLQGNERRSKEEREARPGLLVLKAFDVLKTFSRNI